MIMKNCFVAQSGGPTAAINSSLAGVIDAVKASNQYDCIYGLLNGITGLFEDRYINLSEQFSTDKSIEQLKTTPAMFLGSCRFQLPSIEEDRNTYEKIFEFFREHQVAAFFYIGGNDSMDTAMKLAAYAKEIQSNIKIIGVPKTIDNDLVEIDHTPGFGSAAKYVAASMLEMAYDTAIYKLNSVTIVEIMGRDAGWLTAASALARTEFSDAPHLIYLPEVPFDKDQFLEDVKQKVVEYNNVLVAISEGIRDKDGNYISATEASVDQFGHSQLSGAGKTLERLVSRELRIKVRSVEINILQRCGGHFASRTDIEEAFLLGKNAVKYAEDGITGMMSTLTREAGDDYKVSYGYADLNQIANKVKSVPLSFINEAHNDVTKEALEYLSPLIQGEYETIFKNGLPSYTPIYRG
ncbi:MAG: 6-phosphofructokinase [Lachnospiraceae bacterium]|nr:6-phosphofructokinase [Lachnospiraceae bacterium]